MIQKALVSYNRKSRLWTLEEYYSLSLPLSGPGRKYSIHVKRGFPFDLASVPWAFRLFIAKYHLSIEAALIHDFIYTYDGVPPRDTVVPYRTFTRRDADEIFWSLMERQSVPAWQLRPAYWGVRLFGWIKWRRMSMKGGAS